MSSERAYLYGLVLTPLTVGAAHLAEPPQWLTFLGTPQCPTYISRSLTASSTTIPPSAMVLTVSTSVLTVTHILGMSSLKRSAACLSRRASSRATSQPPLQMRSSSSILDHRYVYHTRLFNHSPDIADTHYRKPEITMDPPHVVYLIIQRLLGGSLLRPRRICLRASSLSWRH